MMRGINHQNIFEDEEDNYQFRELFDSELIKPRLAPCDAAVTAHAAGNDDLLLGRGGDADKLHKLPIAVAQYAAGPDDYLPERDVRA